MQTGRVVIVGMSVAVAACSINTSLFTEGEVLGGSGAGGPTSTSSSSNGAGNSVTVTNSVSATTSTSGGSPGVGGMTSVGGSPGVGGMTSVGGSPGVGGSGGTPTCAHDPCDEGVALDANCDDPCVGQICASDPFCCSDDWDELCTFHVFDICGNDCNPGLPTCDTQHAGSTGYVDICGQTGEVCSVAFAQTNCGDLCAAAGTECLTVFNNQQGTICQQTQQFNCQQNANDAICICSRGCGAGQPCAAGLVCDGGQCVM